MKSAKNLLKNKSAMQRLRNERIARNALTLKTNKSRVGARPAAKLMTFNNNKPKKSGSPRNKKPFNNNIFKKSIHAYKHLVAIPYAVSGLHNPRSPGYHDELVENLKNYQERNPALVPVHNKNWAVNQIKRNVYKVVNKNKVPIVIKPVIKTRPTKTHKMLDNRKKAKKGTTKKSTTKKVSLTKKVYKKPEITNALLNKIVRNTLKILNKKSTNFTKISRKEFKKAMVNMSGRPELMEKRFKARILALTNKYLVNDNINLRNPSLHAKQLI